MCKFVAMIKLMHIFLSLLLIISTTGVNVSAHFCEGRFMDMEINNILFQTDAGEEMGCCQLPDGQYDHCRHIKCTFHVNSQFAQGQIVQLHPSPTNTDWFHGYLPSILPSPIHIEEIVQPTAFFYQSPYHTSDPPTYLALRAPPAPRS